MARSWREIPHVTTFGQAEAAWGSRRATHPPARLNAIVKMTRVVEALERLYPNTFGDLRVGRIRYGLMLNDQGVILDDGTVCRLTDDEFFWEPVPHCWTVRRDGRGHWAPDYPEPPHPEPPPFTTIGWRLVHVS